MFLIYDTETTGLPKSYKAPLTDFDNWPRVVQLAWQIHDENGALVDIKNFIIKPEGFIIPRGSEKIHGISTDRANREGQPLEFVLNEFNKALSSVKTIAGHNLEFDNSCVGSEFLRKEMVTPLFELNMVDTIPVSTEYCELPGGKGGNYKWPTLKELYLKLFDENFVAAHNASADVQATARCFLEMIRIGLIKEKDLDVDEKVIENFIDVNPEMIQSIGIDVEPYHEEIDQKVEKQLPEVQLPGSDEVESSEFTHLHVHTQYSILDGLSKINLMMDKAKADGMKAVAITDHGYMFGVKHFHNEAKKAGIKPLIGSEVYVARRGLKRKESKIDGSGWHLILIAKNETGYKNLMHLSSIASVDGYYYKPRIDKELLREHREGLIALTACLGGEIPNKIINEGEQKAEEALLEYIDIFGEDLYLEMQRHPTGNPDTDRKVYDDQVYVNKALMQFSEKHNVKLIATNDVHFINAEDAGAHDRLICIGTASDIDDPKRLQYTRQEWFKTQAEMRELFADVPVAISNTKEIVDKVEFYELDHKPIMPEFVIPDEFADADAYLKHITYEGAKKRYGELTTKLTYRIDFELETIKKMGFPDYFLIVWDFLKAARDMGVSVGPGRGSAAGSVVSYSLRITDIDPIKYDLLFERFLNPDRISMPDIDIDFDDDGRDKILKWVSDKYGKTKVAHLITFGTMAAKLAIRDVSRVQKLPLSEADRLAKMIPERPGTTMKMALKEVPEFKFELDKGKPEVSSVIKNALTLEGSIRNTGTHACGVIIGRKDLSNYVPLANVKDSVLSIATQFDGGFIESIGLLKMDFLGLKTLSIIKDTIENISRSKGIDMDVETIPFDDKATYDLYSRGDTTALFQFESEGMQKHLKDLKPSRFEDLIAMNALYRPGPMQYIPEFIERKHGRKEITYDIPIMEEILKETYGITVYQEQVMLLSRKMAGFSRGQSDSLRKAMGKKKLAEMAKLKVKFIEGCEKNGLAKDKVEKVWKDWEEFAKYAFNKSHATCYSHLSYQTAYLKTHFPAEFMAANLSRNLHDIKKITMLVGETNHMGIKVMGPDVNESALNFTVTKNGNIRFGMAAIKGVGEAAVEQIISEREENGPYKNIFDFVKRVNLRSVNKRSIEALAQAGAFDGFEGVHRAQFFHQENEESPVFIEKVIKHGNLFQEREKSQQASLFGQADDAFEVKDPPMPECDSWSMAKMLMLEKDVTGFYISGHPLDDFKKTMDRFCNVEVNDLKTDLKKYFKEKVMFAGMVTEFQQKSTKRGAAYGRFVVEDFSGNLNLALFNENYLKYKHLLEIGNKIFVIANIEERYGQVGNYEIRIDDIYLLDEAMGKLAKSITVSMSVVAVNEQMISDLASIAKQNVGDCSIQIHLDDPENGKYVKLKTTSIKVEPRAFVHEIEKLNDLNFRIN